MMLLQTRFDFWNHQLKLANCAPPCHGEVQRRKAERPGPGGLPTGQAAATITFSPAERETAMPEGCRL